MEITNGRIKINLKVTLWRMSDRGRLSLIPSGLFLFDYNFGCTDFF
jgi:hypothetical protein